MWLSINQSIDQNLYSASSKSRLRGAPNSSQAETNSLEKVVELGQGTVWEVLWSEAIHERDRQRDIQRSREAETPATLKQVWHRAIGIRVSHVDAKVSNG